MPLSAENLIDLMCASMTDERIIELLDGLGLEQPVLDEQQYEIDREIIVNDSKNTGLVFVFAEDVCCEEDPCLMQVDFMHDKFVHYPFGLSASDTYEDCCKKIGKKPEYQLRWDSDQKIWLIGEKESQKVLSIDFHEGLSEMRCIVVTTYKQDGIKAYVANQD